MKADTIDNYGRPTDPDDGLLTSRVHDALRIARDSSVSKYIGFLDERRQALCSYACARVGGIDCRFFGGYEGAERVMLGLIPPGGEERFPIAALTLRVRPCAALTHRDWLGSLLALGLKRESVGDLLCEPGRCVAFVAESVAPVILRELTRVGGEGVKVVEGFSEPLPAAHRFAEKSVTVASVRLDGVVSALFACSRSQAAEWIRLGLVAVNGLPCQKGDAPLRGGDRLAVRGKGKFILDACDRLTRKGRVVLEVRQYL